MTESSSQEVEFAKEVYSRLVDAYGEKERDITTDPLDMLVGTMLSANTNDVNSGRAFRELMSRYDGSWDSVRHAPLDDIKDAIRVAGMYNQKAPNIVRTLEMIYDDQGDYRLDVLESMDVDEAMEYLTRLPGVGHKTASIVLLFRYGKATLPVDTHLQRIAQRLGIVGPKASPEQVKRAWEALLPPDTFFTLHVAQIEHGREVCHARSPECDVCPLQDLCDYYHKTGEWSDRTG